MPQRGVVRTILKLINRDSVLVSDIVETLKLPSKGVLSHTLDISLGMPEEEVRTLLNECILREHKNPLKGIDLVLSANAWPEIYRFVFDQYKLISVIVEIGVDSSNFQNVYSRVLDRISELFAYSIEAHKQEGVIYPYYQWENAKHFCYFQVVSDKILNYNALWLDYNYFGHELDGTFIRKRGKRFTVLPTLAVIFSANPESRAISIAYLQLDLLKRDEATSLMNLPALVDME